jgi:hypothetical protein
MRSFILLPCLCLLTAACATRVFIPTNRFLSPESSGDIWRGDVKLASAGVTQVQIADDMTLVSPDLTPVLSRNSSLLVGGSLGVASFLDLYINATASAPLFAGVKLQLLGDPAPSAKAGNFSLALAGGAAMSSTKQTYESGGVKGESEMKFSGWEATVLLGYRFGDNFMMYTGPFKSSVKTAAAIQRTISGVTTVTAQPDGIGESTGGVLGLRWGSSVYFTIEGAYSNNQWTREKPSELKAEELNALVGGLAIGGAW